MKSPDPAKPRIFIDADVLIAGAASPNEHSASLVLLRMAEITLIDAIVSEQVIIEAERNIRGKIPSALPAFQLLIKKSLQCVSDPLAESLAAYQGKADDKDLLLLDVAYRERCAFLATFSGRHYEPGLPEVKVVRPGELVLQVRYLLSAL